MIEDIPTYVYVITWPLSGIMGLHMFYTFLCISEKFYEPFSEGWDEIKENYSNPRRVFVITIVGMIFGYVVFAVGVVFLLIGVVCKIICHISKMVSKWIEQGERYN